MGKFKERSPRDTMIREILLTKALAEIKDEFKKGINVLDAGCGDGIFLTMLAKQVDESIKLNGLDISDNMLNVSIRKAKEQNLNINYFKGSIADMPCKDNEYDLAFCTMMFHHLDKELKFKSLEEYYRVLKKGGKLIFVDIHPPKGIWKNIVWAFTRTILTLTHLGTTYGLGKISELMRDKGFVIKKETYIEFGTKLIVGQKL